MSSRDHRIFEAEIRNSELVFLETLKAEQGERDMFFCLLSDGRKLRLDVNLRACSAAADTVVFNALSWSLQGDSVTILCEDGTILDEEASQTLAWELLEDDPRVIGYAYGREFGNGMPLLPVSTAQTPDPL